MRNYHLIFTFLFKSNQNIYQIFGCGGFSPSLVPAQIYESKIKIKTRFQGVAGRRSVMVHGVTIKFCHLYQLTDHVHIHIYMLDLKIHLSLSLPLFSLQKADFLASCTGGNKYQLCALDLSIDR